MAVTVTESSFETGAAQGDGAVPVTERHLLSDGRSVSFEYLAPSGVDPAVVMAARAVRVAAEVTAREEALLIAGQGEIPLTKFQFRQRFTYAERVAVDAFNAGFEAHAVLTAEQKAAIRTNLADFNASGAVFLTNPSTVAGVQLYESLGLIAPGRAAGILNG